MRKVECLYRSKRLDVLLDVSTFDVRIVVKQEHPTAANPNKHFIIAREDMEQIVREFERITEQNL